MVEPSSAMRAAAGAPDRFALWEAVLGELQPAHVVEVGVFRGEFAERMLRAVPSIERYDLIDPWRHLPQWNKPYNAPEVDLGKAMDETIDRLRFAGSRVNVLRGTTAEVIDQIEDATVDLAYIDGDHTLRGITQDLLLVRPKMKADGLIGGDDFRPSIWQHDRTFEPTFVYPYAVYFAEAVDRCIHALGHAQFAIEMGAPGGFTFEDTVGVFEPPSVLRAMEGGAAAPAPPRRFGRRRR